MVGYIIALHDYQLNSHQHTFQENESNFNPTFFRVVSFPILSLKTFDFACCKSRKKLNGDPIGTHPTSREAPRYVGHRRPFVGAPSRQSGRQLRDYSIVHFCNT
jgi:hypothetical protein